MKQEQSDEFTAQIGKKTPIKPKALQLHQNSRVRKVIAVAGEIGGVGCSMVTSLLAVCMQRRGFHIGILDANYERPSVAWSLGAGQTAEKVEGAWVPMRMAVGIDIISINLFPPDEKTSSPALTPLQLYSEIIWKDVDILFVNLPALGRQTDLTMFYKIAFDGLLAVTKPKYAQAQAVIDAAQFANIPILGIIENFSPALPLADTQADDENCSVADTQPDAIKVLGRIPPLKRLASGQEEGMVETFEGNWLDKAADALEMLLD
jgi:Mrp family chromosome partitioning ATPase